MPRSLLIRSGVLFLLTTCFTIAAVERGAGNILDRYKYKEQRRFLDPDGSTNGHTHVRVKRGFFGKKGFLRTLFSTAYEQWVDTKDTWNSINKQINDNFLDENAPVVVTTPSSDPNATTTEAPFKITRKEFYRIINRNLKGIARLFRLELKDALSTSHETDREFKKDASKELSKFL